MFVVHRADESGGPPGIASEAWLQRRSFLGDKHVVPKSERTGAGHVPSRPGERQEVEHCQPLLPSLLEGCWRTCRQASAVISSIR